MRQHTDKTFKGETVTAELWGVVYSIYYHLYYLNF